MISNNILWAPVFATAVLMYLARVFHIAVLHYNVFLILLMLWSGLVIGFFRFMHKRKFPAGRIRK
ncbi:MAG TPA: hypothetical protein ENN79_10700 [Desulfobacteraceae bacterium]|nr:hypothetical protein [Desulfobacteraceae bacterium]